MSNTQIESTTFKMLHTENVIHSQDIKSTQTKLTLMTAQISDL